LANLLGAAVRSAALCLSAVRIYLASMLALLVGVSLTACRQGPETPDQPSPNSLPATVEAPLLAEITFLVGLDLEEPRWPDGSFELPEISGPGTAMLDYDGDGDLDLLQIRLPPPGSRHQPAPNRLLEQAESGRFEDVTQQAGIGDPGYGMGVAVGDVDNDGDSEVYITNVGQDRFYRNNGDGTFRDATVEAGFEGDRWNSGSTFCDYDLDGDLDLFIAGYLDYVWDRTCTAGTGEQEYCGPLAHNGLDDRLYNNRGDGVFRDVSAESGLHQLAVAGQLAAGFQVVCTDLTADGLPDFYVANDQVPNYLWVNGGDGTFREEAVQRGVAVSSTGAAEASMGVALGDLNRDGRLDLYLTHLRGETNTVYTGDADGMFTDRTAQLGLGADDFPHTGFGCALFDLDHDTDLDIVVANGAVTANPRAGNPPPQGFWDRYAELNLIVLNTPDGFAAAGSFGGRLAERREVSRGLALGDLDNDGDLDFVLQNNDGSLRAYRNEAPAATAHWLQLRVLSKRRDAVGTVARIETPLGAQIRLVQPSSSFQSSNDPRVHFGLGSAGTIESLELTWPAGDRTRFRSLPANRFLVIVR